MSHDGYSLGTMQKCGICGKQFLVKVADEYVYQRRKTKDSTIYFCSWSHLREYDRRRSEERRKRLEEAAERRRNKEPAADGAVPPLSMVKTKYTIHHCGKCGKRISMEMASCKYCGTPIDW